MNFSNGSQLETDISRETDISYLIGFHNVDKTAKEIAYKYSVIDHTNQNLTSFQKELLRAHYCLGYLRMSAVQ